MNPIIAPLLVLTIYIVVEIYVYLRLIRYAFKGEDSKSISTRRLFRSSYIFLQTISFVTAAYSLTMNGCPTSPSAFYWLSVAFTISIIIFLPTALLALFDLCSRIPVLFHHKAWMPIRKTGYIVATIAFIFLISGIFNRKRISVHTQEIEFATLPQSFDGYRIVQISDLHLVSFGSDTTFISQLVDKINLLNPDIILFTGDIVTRQADEISPFTSTLARLSARDGIYSVRGNHDYAKYIQYPHDSLRTADRHKLLTFYARTPIVLLRDSTVTIHRGSDSILISGTENIAHPPYPSFGSLHQTLNNPTAKGFRILLSHDPSFWADSIQNNPSLDIPLTLSGHTHAMQCQLLGLSPAIIRDPLWGNHYQSTDGQRHLNVNTGIGTVGPLIRIGATPQISLITLRYAR